MEDDVFIRSVPGVSVVFPVPYVLIDLDVPWDFHTINEHPSAAEVWTRLTVPNSKMKNFHFLSIFSQPRNTKLSTKNSCLQLQLGDATAGGFAQPESAQRRSEPLVPKILRALSSSNGRRDGDPTGRDPA